jgi:hypothetical protein
MRADADTGTEFDAIAGLAIGLLAEGAATKRVAKLRRGHSSQSSARSGL